MALAWSASVAPLPAVAANTPVPHLRPVHGHRVSQHRPVFQAAAGTLQQGPSTSSTAAPLGTSPWAPLGPQPIVGLSTYGASAGRVTALAARGLIVYAGTADGGVWKSTDGGQTWAPKSDTQPTLAIGAIAISWGATTATDTVYAGTGEGNHCQDCLPSQGLLKSVDGGTTWAAPISVASGTYFFDALVIDRTNNQHLMAATTAGLYESTNAGVAWTQRRSGRFDTVGQDPSVAAQFWASHTTSCESAPSTGEIGIWNASNLTWTSSWNGTNPALPVHAVRIGLDVGPNSTAYAAVATCQESTYVIGQSEGILKTTNGGLTWSVVTPPDYFTVTSGTQKQAQGWYDNVVAVDPSDGTGNTAVFGGITMVTTTDGGASFQDVAFPYNGGPIHPDFHAIAFTGPHTFYTGNDGGIYSTSNLGATGQPSDWTNRNAGLSVTQFYQGSSVDLTHLVGGSQDNGTAGNPQGAAPAAWASLLDGDGFWTAMIPGQNTLFSESSAGDIYQIDYSGSVAPTEVAPCSAPYTDPSCNDPTGFSAPYVIDPTSSTAGSARLYAGTNFVYRTVTGGLPFGGTTAGAAWSKISNDLTTGTGGGAHPADFINTMAIGAGTTSGTVITGSWFGRIYQVNNGPAATTGSWVDITGNLPAWSAAADSGNAWVTGVAVNPLDSTEAWVTIGTTTGSRIWHTNNAGTAPTTWTDISTTLPANLVLDSITVDPIKPQNVYIGTDAGAMACATCGTSSGTVIAPSWVPLGTGGLPNVRVDYISLTQNDVDLVAWTHGRGAWYLPRPFPTPGASLQPTRLSFGNRTLYTTSSPQTATLSSTGTPGTTLTVSNIAAGGGDFAINNNSQSTPCPTTFPFVLPQGSSCNIGVTFTPSTQSAETGTLTVSDNAADSPQTTQLDGTGTLQTFWESLGGSLTSSPAATSWGPNRLDIFARGRDNALYHMWWDGTTWQYWVRLGGSLTSDPVAVSWGANRLDVFARGNDLALYHTWSTDGGANWNYWVRLGGTLASNPSASSWGSGRIDLYAAGQDHALYHMWTSNGGNAVTDWTYWTFLGGSLTTDPAASSWGSGRLDVFAAGQDKALYHMWSTDGGTTWTYWSYLGGTLASSPAATTWGPTRIDLVALGQDKGLYHKWSNDGTTFTSWQAEAGTWTLNPTAASRAQHVIDVFVRGNDAALWHKAIAG